MSKQKQPEVGDVWQIDSRKIVIKRIEDVSDYFEGTIKDALYCIEDYGHRIDTHWYHPEKLKKKGKYLGKSKANINDLFEVLK